MELQMATTTFPPPSPEARVASPPRPPVRAQSTGTSWTAWTLATVTPIWVAVVLISVFAPDMIHGSEQQHMPVAAFGTWLWGVGASVVALVALTRLRGALTRR